MYDRDSDYNYIDEKNNVEIVSCTSCHKNCQAKNILNEDLKLIWLSEKEVPQSIIIDISNINKKPENNQFEFFGVHLWHSYQSNPKEIELSFSHNNKDFILVGIYELELRPGIQFFKIENGIFPNNNLINFLKITITKTYGGIKTYLNQIFLLDTLSQYDNKYLQAFQDNNIENEDDEIEEEKNSDNVKTNNIIINDYYKLRNKMNKNYNQEIKNKKKELNVNINKKLSKVKENKNNSQNKKNKSKKKKGIDINTLASNNSSFSNNDVELYYKEKKKSNNQNFSYPSFSISNYKSVDSTNQSIKLKNSLSKKVKDTLKEDLKNKLKDMNTFIKTISGDTTYSTEKIKYNSPSFNRSPFMFETINNTYNNNYNNQENNFLNHKVEIIEKKINKIQNDVNDIKNFFFKINSDRNVIFDNGNKIINTDNNIISEDEQSYNNINNNNFQVNNSNGEKDKFKSINKKNKYHIEYIENFDNKLNQKLDELSNNIENQIYKNFIEPSVEQFNKKMKNSLYQMKKQIDAINNNNIREKKNKKNKELSSYSSSNKILQSISYNNKDKKSNTDIESISSSLNNENNLQIKYEKITSISNKLYNKLCEKERILNDKTIYLKQKFGNNNMNTFTSINSY
jgi:hypothetical protein